jgi:hypothetical protein
MSLVYLSGGVVFWAAAVKIAKIAKEVWDFDERLAILMSRPK